MRMNGGIMPRSMKERARISRKAGCYDGSSVRIAPWCHVQCGSQVGICRHFVTDPPAQMIKDQSLGGWSNDLHIDFLDALHLEERHPLTSMYKVTPIYQASSLEKHAQERLDSHASDC